MIQLYEIYKENQKVRTLLAQLSWTNDLLILRGTICPISTKRAAPAKGRYFTSRTCFLSASNEGKHPKAPKNKTQRANPTPSAKDFLNYPRQALTFFDFLAMD